MVEHCFWFFVFFIFVERSNTRFSWNGLIYIQYGKQRYWEKKNTIRWVARRHFVTSIPWARIIQTHVASCKLQKKAMPSGRHESDIEYGQHRYLIFQAKAIMLWWLISDNCIVHVRRCLFATLLFLVGVSIPSICNIIELTVSGMNCNTKTQSYYVLNGSELKYFNLADSKNNYQWMYYLNKLKNIMKIL